MKIIVYHLSQFTLGKILIHIYFYFHIPPPKKNEQDLTQPATLTNRLPTKKVNCYYSKSMKWNAHGMQMLSMRMLDCFCFHFV